MTTREAYRSRERLRAKQPVRPADIAAQLIADIIHRKVEAVQEQQAAVVAAATQRRRRGRAWYFLVALPLLIGLSAWNLVRATSTPEVFSVEERESAVRFRMYLAAQAVEAYRDSLRRWPADLGAVGFADAGFVYQAGERDFEISDTSASVPLTYRRGDPLRPFAGAYHELKHHELKRRGAP